MRTTRYGEPSAAEIDRLRTPPRCDCGADVEEYGQICEECEDNNESERRADILLDDLKYSDP
jgi:hypothetical protein